MNYYIVIGASRGVGAAIVEQLLALDAVIVAVSRSRSEALLSLARERATTLHWLSRDLSDPSSADSLLKEIADILTDRMSSDLPEHIALFLSAAQLQPIGVAGTLPSDKVDGAVRLNLATPITVTQQFLHHFGDAPCPVRAILLSSGASQRTMPGLSVYGATKAGMNAFVRAAQVEIDGEPERFQDVKLYAVSPGKVDTAMQDTLRATDTAALPERDVYQRWKDEGTLSRPAEAAQKLIGVLSRADIAPGSYVHMSDL